MRSVHTKLCVELLQHRGFVRSDQGGLNSHDGGLTGTLELGYWAKVPTGVGVLVTFKFDVVGAEILVDASSKQLGGRQLWRGSLRAPDLEGLRVAAQAYCSDMAVPALSAAEKGRSQLYPSS